MGSSKDDGIQYLAKALREALAELDEWRALYPRQAHGVREEAIAKLEGREPRHLPPIIFGARHG